MPWNSQPTYVASCWASGPGSRVQNLRAWRNCSSSIHFRSSTSVRCIRAICPAGPPKLRNPIFVQTRVASPNDGRSAGGIERRREPGEQRVEGSLAPEVAVRDVRPLAGQVTADGGGRESSGREALDHTWRLVRAHRAISRG